MKLAALIAIAAAAAVPLAGCESLSRGADQVRDLANHEPEHVTYPSLLDVPAKPTPLNTSADRQHTVQSLKGDQADAAAQAAELRDKAANMQTIAVPGYPPPAQQPAPKPAQTAP